MGCKLGKLAASEFSQDPLERPPPATDPRVPLTAKQQYCMLASWKGIFRQIEKTGVILFIKLFEDNEDLLHLFEKFRELRTIEDQLMSDELAEHATRVMHTLDEGIKGLGDADSFFKYIRHVGATHHQVPGFKAENFWKIEQPFLQAAKTTLGDRYTPNIESIYKITIRFILENLVKGYEDAGKEKEEAGKSKDNAGKNIVKGYEDAGKEKEEAGKSKDNAGKNKEDQGKNKDDVQKRGNEKNNRNGVDKNIYMNIYI